MIFLSALTASLSDLGFSRLTPLPVGMLISVVHFLKLSFHPHHQAKYKLVLKTGKAEHIRRDPGGKTLTRGFCVISSLSHWAFVGGQLRPRKQDTPGLGGHASWILSFCCLKPKWLIFSVVSRGMRRCWRPRSASARCHFTSSCEGPACPHPQQPPCRVGPAQIWLRVSSSLGV